MYHADLHTHTIHSDGEYTPAHLGLMALQSGIRYLAYTDHNYNYSPAELNDLRLQFPMLRILRGCEFSCFYRTADQRRVEIHIVGLNFDPDCPELQAVLRRNQPDRRSYVTKILNKLDALGVGIGTYEDLMAFCNGPQHLGRMHIARSLVAHGYVKTVDEAFDTYIGSFGQRLAYVESELDYAPIEDVLSALQKAQGIAILAHLFFYPLDDAEQHRLLRTFKTLAGPCSGMEVYYGRYSDEQRRHLAELAAQYELLPSAGSDFHGPGDGNATPPRSMRRWKPVSARCTASSTTERQAINKKRTGSCFFAAPGPFCVLLYRSSRRHQSSAVASISSIEMRCSGSGAVARSSRRFTSARISCGRPDGTLSPAVMVWVLSRKPSGRCSLTLCTATGYSILSSSRPAEKTSVFSVTGPENSSGA